MGIYTALLYNEVNLISMILLFVVLKRTIGNSRLKSKLPSFMYFIASLMILTVGDMVWAFVECNIIPATNFWGYFTNIVYFLGSILSAYFMFMVFMDIFGYNGNYLKKALLIGIPFIIDFVFVALTPITHLVFSYTEEGYQRSSLYVVAMGIPYIFIVYLCISSFICSFNSKYYVLRRSLRIMSLYAAAMLGLAMFQLVSTYTFPLYVVGGTMTCLLMYIDRVNELNTVDSLTKLQTNRSFENYLSRIMQRETNGDKRVYLMLLDVDDFKSVNDIYGREEGDVALVNTARIIEKSTPTGWFAARFGGDEFALVGLCAQEEIDHICTQLNSGFEEYNLKSTKPYALTVSIGYASLSYNCKTVNDFVKLAQKRLDEEVEKTRRGIKRTKNDQMREIRSSTNNASNGVSIITQQDINLWMNDALKNGEFIPYFQPQIDVSTGKISGAEALARWVHPEKGLIFPSIFIPVFERNGFIYEMDKSIWHSVMKLIRKWKDEGRKIPSISVNISRWDIVQSDFIDTLTGYLKEFDLKSSDVHLEITESAYLFDQDYLIRVMENLQNLGFEIEMDDFGSGYSSLTAFKDLPFNLLKLDASLIRESTKSEKAGNILKGIIRLAKSLDMPLIAEGVEYKEQADLLKQMGCVNMQGYLFAKPMAPDKFIEFTEEWEEEKKAL